MPRVRETKCGSRKHKTSECSADLSKTRGFPCGNLGRKSANCTQKPLEEGNGKGKKGIVKLDQLNQKEKRVQMPRVAKARKEN